jgi:hypothetical protein
MRRRWWLAGAAVALLALGVVVVARDHGGGARAPTTSTSTSAPTTTTTTTVVDRSTAIWPPPASGRKFTDPVEAAGDFARSYLHFTAPVLGKFQQGDSRSGEVEVRPRVSGPVTTVLVRQLGDDMSWWVLGAATPGIEVDQPATGDEVVSPVTVAGRAWAFEGTVEVEVRADGRSDAVGAGFVTGGGDMLRPFRGEIAFSTASSTYGALVLFTRSAENGEVWTAAAMRVRLAATDAARAS